MTAVRWVVEHPGEPPIGGWVEYPDEAAAREHAGGAGTVWALVPPDAVRVLDAAVAWRDPTARTRLATVTADLMRAVDALSRKDPR